jgi:hypothetical protein
MRPPEEEVIRKIVSEWKYKADQDLRSAEALLAQDPPLLYPSQQETEGSIALARKVRDSVLSVLPGVCGRWPPHGKKRSNL